MIRDLIHIPSQPINPFQVWWFVAILASKSPIRGFAEIMLSTGVVPESRRLFI